MSRTLECELTSIVNVSKVHERCLPSVEGKMNTAQLALLRRKKQLRLETHPSTVLLVNEGFIVPPRPRADNFCVSHCHSRFNNAHLCSSPFPIPRSRAFFHEQKL